MSKSKVIFVILLLILGGLVAGLFLLPFAGKETSYSVVQQEGVLRTANGWVVQFDIVNSEDQDKNYTVNLLVDDRPSAITALVRAGGIFTYIRSIDRSQVTGGKVTLSVYKDNLPVREATYYLQGKE